MNASKAQYMCGFVVIVIMNDLGCWYIMIVKVAVHLRWGARNAHYYY